MGSGLVVTGGVLCGRRLRPPSDRAVRPTAARVREALFSILGQQLDGQRVLDLFAGTGSIGIEAASRGASEVVFVEKDPSHVRIIESNIMLIEEFAASQVVRRDACSSLAGLARADRPFDFVFMDPPYGRGLATACLDAMAPITEELFARDAVIAVESDGREQLPPQVGAWILSDNRSYGQTDLDFYRHGEART